MIRFLALALLVPVAAGTALHATMPTRGRLAHLLGAMPCALVFCTSMIGQIGWGGLRSGGAWLSLLYVAPLMGITVGLVDAISTPCQKPRTNGRSDRSIGVPADALTGLLAGLIAGVMLSLPGRSEIPLRIGAGVVAGIGVMLCRRVSRPMTRLSSLVAFAVCLSLSWVAYHTFFFAKLAFMLLAVGAFMLLAAAGPTSMRPSRECRTFLAALLPTAGAAGAAYAPAISPLWLACIVLPCALAWEKR